MISVDASESLATAKTEHLEGLILCTTAFRRRRSNAYSNSSDRNRRVVGEERLARRCERDLREVCPAVGRQRSERTTLRTLLLNTPVDIFQPHLRMPHEWRKPSRSRKHCVRSRKSRSAWPKKLAMRKPVVRGLGCPSGLAWPFPGAGGK